VESEDPHKRLLEHLVDQEKEERNERRGLEQRALSLFAALLIGVPVVGAVAKDADYGSFAGAFALTVLAVCFAFVLAITARITAALSTNAPEPRSFTPTNTQVDGPEHPRESQTSSRGEEAASERSLRDTLKITFKRERPDKGSTGVRAARVAVAACVGEGRLDAAGRHQAEVVGFLRYENKFMVGEVREATRRVPLVLALLVLGLGLLVAAKNPAPQPESGPQGARGAPGPAGASGPHGHRGPRGRRGPAGPSR